MVTKQTVKEFSIMMEVTRPTKTGFEKVLLEKCLEHNMPKAACGCSK